MATATPVRVLTIAEIHHGTLENQQLAFMRHERLVHAAHDAEAMGIQLERESATQWIAWQDDVPGECDLVSEDGCTCGRFRIFRICEHQALLLRQLGRL